VPASHSDDLVAFSEDDFNVSRIFSSITSDCLGEIRRNDFGK
jgi:hypothetical protein